MEKLSRIKIIKTFFEADGGRKVTFEELKALSLSQRTELSRLAAAELGVEIEESK